MFRTITSVTVALALASTALAQQGPQRGKIVKVDAAKDQLTIRAADGTEYECSVTGSTRFMGTDGGPLKERLKAEGFKADVPVMFRIARRDGKRVILDGLKLGDMPPGGGNAGRRSVEKVDTSSFKPLTELGSQKYQDFEGGLYPGGRNERPAAHETAGLALARAIQPLGASGEPAANGRIVLLSIGMSNTSQEFAAFQELAHSDRSVNPRLVLVNGAQGGMTAAAIQDPLDQGRGTKFWETVDERLRQAGVTRAQVQAVWLKQADAGPNSGFPAYARTLQAEMAKIAQVLNERFANLKLVYVSSRIYAGYATTPLNPEPYAYESGFAVKWLIEQQLSGEAELNFDPEKGRVRAPWLSWGPYLSANGKTPREDGLSYEESDLGNDGTHPSGAGQQKVARVLLEFFKNDSTTKGWFVGS